MSTPRRRFSFALVLACSAGTALPAEIPVGPGQDLADLLSNAQDGDVFVLDNGLYIAQTISLPPVRNVTIRSSAGPADTIIILDPQQSPGTLFDLNGGADITIKGVTLRANGVPNGWDTLVNAQGIDGLAINNAILEGPGRGVLVGFRSRFRASATTFQNLNANQDGPAVSVERGGRASLVACVFTGNGDADSGRDGGAIYARDAHVLVRGSSFQSNTAGNRGGAIAANGQSRIDIADSVFANNTADQFGGAVAVESGSLRVLRSRFHGNTAGIAGAIFARAAPGFTAADTLAIHASTFEDNAADQSAQLYLESADTSFSNNTVLQTGPGADPAVRFVASSSGFNGPAGSATHNIFLGPLFFGAAEDSSSAIAGTPAMITNSIIRGFGESPFELQTGDARIDFNNIEGAGDDSPFGPNTIDEDPMFVDVAGRDFRLMQGSPSIDAGSAALVGRDALDLNSNLDAQDPLAFDALGTARVVADAEPRPDHGAFEFDRDGSAPACPADLAPPFGIADLADLDAFIQSFIAGCP